VDALRIGANNTLKLTGYTVMLLEKYVAAHGSGGPQHSYGRWAY